MIEGGKGGGNTLTGLNFEKEKDILETKPSKTIFLFFPRTRAIIRKKLNKKKIPI